MTPAQFYKNYKSTINDSRIVSRILNKEDVRESRSMLNHYMTNHYNNDLNTRMGLFIICHSIIEAIITMNNDWYSTINLVVDKKMQFLCYYVMIAEEKPVIDALVESPELQEAIKKWNQYEIETHTEYNEYEGARELIEEAIKIIKTW